jgi:hypothetical protein
MRNEKLEKSSNIMDYNISVIKLLTSIVWEAKLLFAITIA